MRIGEARLRKIERVADQVERGGIVISPELRCDVSIAEFVLGDKYLAQPHIYAKQLTLLRTIFLEEENFTGFDRRVIDDWMSQRHLGQPTADGLFYEGSRGIAPDIYERISQLRAEGRWHFEEVVNVLGRRGSKGYIGAICAARILWDLICGPPPHERFGIPKTKRLAALVFAGQKDQAVGNQFRDIAELITTAPVFEPFVAEQTASSLLLFLPHQLTGRRRPVSRKALFEIRAVAATPLSGRGPAAYMAFFDEMAHMVATGANRGADEVYGAARPALAQFGPDAFVYQASSPWTREGRFHENARMTDAVHPETLKALQPEMFGFQGPSWELYACHELTQRGAFEMYPGGPPLPPTPPPIIEETTAIVVREKKYHFENYRPEYLGEWAAVLDAYLPPEDIAVAFGPWNDRILTIQHSGALSVDYHAHGDPSVSGANFGFAIAHLETVAGERFSHLQFDVLHAWEPKDYGGRLDYETIEDDLADYARRFPISVLSFDQFNAPGILAALRRQQKAARLPHRTSLIEQTAGETSNWAAYETLKTALAMRLVHFPHYPLARLELEHLQRHNRKIAAPTRGPVQTKDMADSIAQITYRLYHDLLSPGRSDFNPVAYERNRRGFAQERGPYADQFSAAGRRHKGLSHEEARQQYPARVPRIRNR